jgi:TetR/AcrR family transcriptional regulator, cholesterol catabolism regulator
MAVRPTRPALRERFDRRQEELVAGAAREFAHRGYDQTTMQELAAALGVATGALYHYFSAKEQLLRAICDQLMEPLLASARQLVADEAEPAERLRGLVRVWVAHVCAHRDHMLVFQQERHVIESGPHWRSVRDSRKAFERVLAGTLDDVGADGLRLEPGLSLRALLSMVNYTPSWYRPRGALRPEQIADGYVDLLLARG